MSVHSSICGGGAVLSGVFHGKRKVRFLWEAAHVLFSPSLHPHLLHSSSHLLIIFSFSPPHLFLTFSLFHSLRHLLHPPPLSHPPCQHCLSPGAGVIRRVGFLPSIRQHSSLLVPPSVQPPPLFSPSLLPSNPPTLSPTGPPSPHPHSFHQQAMR